MSSKELLGPNSYSFAENITLDLHDIVGILLRERLLSDTRFRQAKLREVSDGAWPASSVPMEVQRIFLDKESPKVGYFLRTTEMKDKDFIVEPHNFLHEGLKSPRELDMEEVETIFWRIKNHDFGFPLHHALQLVLDYLPASANLRIRTSDGYSISCSPQSFAVAHMDVLPKTSVYISHVQPREFVNGSMQTPMAQFAFGEKWHANPWVYLVFGKGCDLISDKESDKCVALDINTSVLGIRGLGGEPFAMERRRIYHNKVLPRAAEEDLELSQSHRIVVNPEEAKLAIELAKRVLARLEGITRRGEQYCSYCGKAEPMAQCSRCRGKSKYCGSACQKKAWRYHKTWCKIDAAATAEQPKPNADVEMQG